GCVNRPVANRQAAHIASHPRFAGPGLFVQQVDSDDISVRQIPGSPTPPGPDIDQNAPAATCPFPPQDCSSLCNRLQTALPKTRLAAFRVLTSPCTSPHPEAT